MSRLLSAAINARNSRTALEEVSDGKAVKEIEHTFYARLVNPDDLLQAAGKEHQEQWEIKIDKSDKNASKGSIRIRKTVKENSEPEYVITTKVPVPGTNDKIETPVPTTEGQFKSFKVMAESGMIKDRFFFPVDGSDLVWEIDMFLKPEGGYFEWCKIDLEVKSREDQIPPLPIEFAGIIMNQTGERTEEEETRVRALYDTEFLTKNPGIQ